MSPDEPPLVIVYLGDEPPQYMRAALILAQRFAAVPVQLVAPASFATAVPSGCDHIHTESFYEHDGASAVLRGLQPPTTEHLDLWVRSIERFVVLRSYAEWAGLPSFFHAELDCVPFRLDALDAALQATDRRGMFLPFDHPERVVASLVYVNDHAALAAFVDWASGERYQTEMELLARFAREHPGSVVGLPTLEVLQAPERFAAAGLTVIDPRVMGCVVDAASLGQWVAGVDPRNIRLRDLHRNHFVNENVPDAAALRRARFTWDEFLPLITDADGRSLRVHALHLHAKIHRHVTRRRALERLVRRADRKWARLVPGAIGHAARSVPRIVRIVVQRTGTTLAIRLGDSGVARRSAVIDKVSRPRSLRRYRLLRIARERTLPVNPLATNSPAELTSIEVMIPCAEKDVASLGPVVDSVAQGVVNRVDRVVVVAPSAARLRIGESLGDRVSVEADEDLDLPRTSLAIAELVPIDRRDWVMQQVVKLAFVARSSAEGVLVLDADTMLLEPRIWLRGDRQILPMAHEYHLPYVEHVDRVFGSVVRDEGVSWVTHHQLMQPSVVRDMLTVILRRLTGDGPADEVDVEPDVDHALELWVRSADFTELSPLSEYHTYGVFLSSRSPELAVPARWGNVTIAPQQVQSDLAEILRSFPGALSASGHCYSVSA